MTKNEIKSKIATEMAIVFNNECGFGIPLKLGVCNKCSYELVESEEDYNYCPYCGTKLDIEVENSIMQGIYHAYETGKKVETTLMQKKAQTKPKPKREHV